MNKKIPMYKRIGAMFLCLALLCGVIVSTGAIPEPMTAKADTTADVESFEADFADLAANVVAATSYGAGTTYTPAKTDTTVNTWFTSRFGMYATQEGSTYKTLGYPGESSSVWDWSGEGGYTGAINWEIVKNGGLRLYVPGESGQMMRKKYSLTVKYDSGELAELKNFEAEVVFNKAGEGNALGAERGGVFVSFRETEPGRLNVSEHVDSAKKDKLGRLTYGTDAVIVGNGTGHYTLPLKDGITAGNYANSANKHAMDAFFADALDSNADYKLYVKVVGTKLIAKVTKVSDGTVIYDNSSSPTTIGDDDAGYLSVGVTGSSRELKSIKVTELNAAGEPIDFGSTKAFSWTTSGKTGYENGKHTYNTEDTADDKDWFDFAENANNGKADKTSIINALNKNFDIYYNSEAHYAQMQAGDKAAYDGQTDDYGWFRGVYEDVWLQRPVVVSKGYSQNLRLITSLVPKQNGEALAYKNFDTTFVVRLDNDDASFVFGFRQATPGKFVNGYFNVNKEQGLVVVNKTGIVVSGGENIYSGHTNNQPNTGDMYNTDATATFATAIPKGAVTIRVKAVGDQVTVSVYNNSTTFYSNTVTIPYTKAGYLAYGVANRGSDMGTITLTHLDESGNVMATNEMTDAEAALFAEPWALSFTDLPGAEYVSGNYTATNKNWINFTSFSDTQAIDYIAEKVDFYYNHEGSHYGEVAPYGNAGGSSESGNWLLFYNNWLQRGSSAGWGERLRQINALVPKDGNGVQAQMKNLSASFEYRFEGGGDGAALFGFRQKNPAKFVNGHNAPNQEQVLVAITRKSIAVAGGSDITKERFYHYDQFADDNFGDVFSADLPQEVLVKIEAVGKNVTVNIYSVDGKDKKYTGTFTVNYTKEGYMAFGIAATGGNFGDLKLNRLDDNGNAIDFTDDSYMEPTWADGKTRFTANFAQLAKQVDTFTDGAYVPQATDTDVNTWASRFGLYMVQEGSIYKQLTHLGQSTAEHVSNDTYTGHLQWNILQSGALRMEVSRESSGVYRHGGQMLRKSLSLALKTSEGNLAKLKNFEAEVVFNKGNVADRVGAVYISFRETEPGRLNFNGANNRDSDGKMTYGTDAVIVGNAKSPYAYRGIGVDGITAGNADDYNNLTLREYFASALNASEDYKLYVKVVGTELIAKVTKVSDGTVIYDNSANPTVIDDDAAGYLSIGVSNAVHELKSITVTELDKNGKVVNFGTATNAQSEKFWFSVVDLIEYTGSRYTATKTNADGTPILDNDGNQISGYSYYGFAGKYGDKAHPDASTAISYLDSKVALYYNCEAQYAQMQAGVKQAYEGQTANTGALDTLLYNKWLQKTGSYGGYQNFRMINSMVPRNSVTGEELQFENFETTYQVRWESAEKGRNSLILGFRQATPGKFTDGYWNINTEQAFVAVTRFGLTIAGGDQIVSNMARDEDGKQLHKSDEGDMYNDDQTYTFDDPATEDVVETLPQEVKIYVKAVGDKVTVKITNVGGSTTYYDNSAEPATVNRTGSGYLAYGLGSGTLNIGEIELYRLDAEGEIIGVNGSDTVADCPWDTSVDRFSETMNSTEDALEELYDFYYSAMEGGTPVTRSESLSDHWALNDDKILMRQNDLDTSATDKVALMSPKNAKYSDFDAVFKLSIDEHQQGTFWVTARQQDGALVGKVVSTPGDTDYVAGQVAVGFAVGGAITISDGTADPIVIAGNTAGTPTGTYTLRVRLYGNMLEVYVNGKQRVARALANTQSVDGYMTFGYSGAPLGIGSVDITRLNEQGVPVNYDPKYVSVSSNTIDPIIVSKGESEAAVRAELDTTLTVTDAEGDSISSEVYWDFSTIDLSMNGDYKLIGYLKETNDVRAVVNVYVGAYDRSITTQYDFADSSQLDDFTSWFMPTTNAKDQPALYTEGTENDGWYVNNGRLTQKNTGIRLTDDELVGGKVIGDVTYQDNRNWRGYASNFSVAVLNTKKFKNFILEVDVVSNYRWTLVGFGAKDYADALSVFPTQTNGGYSFHIEHNSGYNTGTAKFWGYDPDNGKTETIATKVMDPYDLSNATQHVKIIVSDGHVWYYLNDIETPFEVDLPDTYEGGYIFLASNENGGGFDNLCVTDLDAKPINITEILTPEPEESDIDRAAGESLSVAANGVLKVADESGYEYVLPYNLVSDTYRSNIEGKHEFEAEFSPLHNMTVASDLKYTVTVNNKINGDFDPETTVKYYFDHPNDFLDFYSQYSEPKTVSTVEYGDQTYHSGYDGDLVTIDADERWTVKNGRATTSYSANPGGWGGKGKAIGTSTLILKDLNLMNFRLEFDFTQGSNFWYSYLIFGVQDPNKMFGTVYWGDDMTWEVWLADTSKATSTAYDSSLGGGVWCHLEKEGYFNIQGALDGVTDLRYTDDLSSDFIKTYDQSVQHHMVIEVVDGLMSMKVDDSDTYYAGISTDGWGGLVGFGACGNGSTYDNFQVTALDYLGEEVPIDEAEKGWAPQPVPDEYEGWQPVKDEWFFTWGEEYEKEIKDNTKK